MVDRVFIIGERLNGHVMFENKHGMILPDLNVLADWHHEPDCTGWDWEPEPMESPDDWVVQDRVPARAVIDERRFHEKDYRGEWMPVGKYSAGMENGKQYEGAMIEVRCRRKDLPPIPEESKGHFENVLMNCDKCGEFRGHGHECEKTTRTIKLCSVVYWDRPEYPMSTILTEQELERHCKAWRTMHVVSETTVEVPL